MKKAIVIFLTAFTLYSCAKRITPTTSVNNAQVKVNNPPQPAAPSITEVPPPMPTATAEVKPIVEPTAKKETLGIIAGKETFNAKCGSCHELKPAETYTAAKWVKIIDWMAPKAKLNASEKENVLAYVSFYAKTGS